MHLEKRRVEARAKKKPTLKAQANYRRSLGVVWLLGLGDWRNWGHVAPEINGAMPPLAKSLSASYVIPVWIVSHQILIFSLGHMLPISARAQWTCPQMGVMRLFSAEKPMSFCVMPTEFSLFIISLNVGSLGD
jgi:hypothetical protein